MLTEEAKARVEAFLEELEEEWQFDGRDPVGVNTVGSDGDTPLIISLIRDDLQATIDLLEAGADPNAIGEDDFSALHWAAQRGPHFVRALLARGAASGGKNSFGETPQEIARRSGSQELIALFDEERTA
jgi:ankyrin repeat protein